MDDLTQLTFVLSRLARLEFDSLPAFDAAIQGATDEDLRSRLENARAEHEDDLAELAEALRARKASPPETESFRGLHAELHVGAATMVSDEDIARRMEVLEREQLGAYSEAAGDLRFDETTRTRLGSKAERARRHLEWIRKWRGDRAVG